MMNVHIQSKAKYRFVVLHPSHKPADVRMWSPGPTGLAKKPAAILGFKPDDIPNNFNDIFLLVCRSVKRNGNWRSLLSLNSFSIKRRSFSFSARFKSASTRAGRRCKHRSLQFKNRSTPNSWRAMTKPSNRGAHSRRFTTGPFPSHSSPHNLHAAPSTFQPNEIRRIAGYCFWKPSSYPHSSG